VEVTQMSLYLKVLEGENAETLNPQMMLALKEAYLPSLGNNIKCGNSLISTDIGSQEELFNSEMNHDINPFDWEMGFRDIVKGGGFEVVIGNPPWIDIKGLNPVLVDYYFRHYRSAENRMNIYAVFIERAMQFLKSGGLFGYIIPNSLLTQSSYTKLRKMILSGYRLRTIVRLPDNVFDNVVAETMILLLSKGKAMKRDSCEIIVYDRGQTIENIELKLARQHSLVEQNKWSDGNLSVLNIFSTARELSLAEKISRCGVPLEEQCDFCLGLTPYDKYKGHTKAQIEQRAFHSARKKDKTFKRLLSGEDISRYFVQWGGKEWISYGDWLGAPREKRFFTEPRVVVRQIISGNPLRIYAGYCEEELYNTQIAFNILLRNESSFSLKYILAILNSNLMNFYHKNKFLDQSKEVFQKILIQNARRFPIRAIDIGSLADRRMHQEIAGLVERMLDLLRELHKANFDSEKEPIQRQIAATDKKIDKLVYELYGLTEEEIKIVEKSDDR